jgi:heme ABC exporter ATP-binding subunit CcmA
VPAVVRLRSAVCLLGRFPALAGVDLDLVAGEVILLSGPNGAGKTTLLRLLAGLVPLHAGEAVVLGRDLKSDHRGARRELALVGHETACYDELSVRENLMFAVRAAGCDPRVVPTVLDRAGLDDVATVRHSQLSAGQRRRLALAIAMARAPRLLLLDEPHAGLDEAGRSMLDDLVRSTVADGNTVILASHELERARGLADREVVLVGGQTRLPAASVVWAEAVAT